MDVTLWMLREAMSDIESENCRLLHTEQKKSVADR